jgi:acetyl esterase
MAVTPEVRAVLDLIAAAEAAPVDEQSPEDMRQAYAALSALEPRPEVAAVTEVVAPGPGGDIPIRMYEPPAESRAGEPGDDRPPGVLAYFHGGGWTIGSVETHDALCRGLAVGSGAVVASVEYRLAPEHPYPAAVEDAVAATRWLAEHAGELGADGSRLAVGGDSAGGNLATVVARLLRDEGPPLAFQLLVYPTTDLGLGHPSVDENGEGYFLTKDTMLWFRRHYLGDRDVSDPSASPLRADPESLRGLPPALVVTAEYDPLRDEGEAYAEALRAAGVDVRATRYDGVIHGFVAMSAWVPDGKAALDECARAVRDALA